MLNRRSKNLTPSHTMAIDARAKQLKAQGLDIINLSVGEPDFDTPEHVKEGGIAALRAGITKYASTPGIDRARAALAKTTPRDTA